MFGLLRRYFPIALLHLYVAARLIPDLLPAGAVAVAALCIWLIVSASSIPLSFMARRSTMHGTRAFMLAWTGLIAMGMFSSLFVLTLIRDVALLAGFTVSIVAQIEEPLRQFRHWSAAAVPLLAALFTAIGFVNARKRPDVRAVEVPIEGLPLALHGFTIAQISDMHIGPTIKGNHLSAIVDAVNELNADLVAITGDLVDGSVAELAAHTASLARLDSTHGSFFVTGNHEYYSGAQSWIAEMRRLGIN